MKECGLTPMTFLSHARIDAARHFLETTSLPLREIARRCGFENTDGFRRIFQRRLQINPAEYRERFRSSDPAPVNGAARNPPHQAGLRTVS
jgi:transcriptional regulator GlxA family with amidase domain